MLRLGHTPGSSSRLQQVLEWMLRTSQDPRAEQRYTKVMLELFCGGPLWCNRLGSCTVFSETSTVSGFWATLQGACAEDSSKRNKMVPPNMAPAQTRAPLLVTRALPPLGTLLEARSY